MLSVFKVEIHFCGLANVDQRLQHPSRASEDMTDVYTEDHLGFGRSAGEEKKGDSLPESEAESEMETEEVHSYLRAVGSFVNRLAMSDDEYLLHFPIFTVQEKESRELEHRRNDKNRADDKEFNP